MQALLQEIRSAKRDGRLSDPVTWKEARELPYLDACIKEAGRVHPAFGLPLERIVPAGGTTLCGKDLKAGTIVGVQQWAAHRSKEVFGDNVDEWQPERWLIDEPSRRAMEKGLLTVSIPFCTASLEKPHRLTSPSAVWSWQPDMHW